MDEPLKKSIVALHIKSGSCQILLLKAVVNVCCDDKIVFVFDEFQQIAVNVEQRVAATIYENCAASKRPKFLKRFVWIKSAGIYIGKSVARNEVSEIFLEMLAQIFKVGGSGNPRSRANDNSVRAGDRFFYHNDFSSEQFFVNSIIFVLENIEHDFCVGFLFRQKIFHHVHRDFHRLFVWKIEHAREM